MNGTELGAFRRYTWWSLTATTSFFTERLEAAGGELTWEHDRERFVVAASLPVPAEVP